MIPTWFLLAAIAAGSATLLAVTVYVAVVAALRSLADDQPTPAEPTEYEVLSWAGYEDDREARMDADRLYNLEADSGWGQ